MLAEHTHIHARQGWKNALKFIAVRVIAGSDSEQTKSRGVVKSYRFTTEEIPSKKHAWKVMSWVLIEPFIQITKINQVTLSKQSLRLAKHRALDLRG